MDLILPLPASESIKQVVLEAAPPVAQGRILVLLGPEKKREKYFIKIFLKDKLPVFLIQILGFSALYSFLFMTGAPLFLAGVLTGYFTFISVGYSERYYSISVKSFCFGILLGLFWVFCFALGFFRCRCFCFALELIL